MKETSRITSDMVKSKVFFCNNFEVRFIVLLDLKIHPSKNISRVTFDVNHSYCMISSGSRGFLP